MNLYFRHETVRLDQAGEEFLRAKAVELTKTYEQLRYMEESHISRDWCDQARALHREAVERVKSEYMAVRKYLQTGECGSYVLTYLAMDPA